MSIMQFKVKCKSWIISLDKFLNLPYMPNQMCIKIHPHNNYYRASYNCHKQRALFKGNQLLLQANYVPFTTEHFPIFSM